jgi:hypothetical protein
MHPMPVHSRRTRSRPLGRAEVDRVFSVHERRLLAPLSAPVHVQAFLDGLAYSADPIYRSPRSVMRDGKAHCFDGALLAAAALRRLGHPPLLLDLRAVRDDDHVLAVFRTHGCFGAVGKSNFVGLRFREPVFRTLRELALSYFEDYFNSEGEKTLRAYSTLLDLRGYDTLGWMTDDAHLERIAERLDSIRHFPLLTARMVAALNPVDARSQEAGMLGVNEAGLYRPR